MKRGTAIRRDTDEGLVLERRMITRRDLLELMRDRCIGCEVCVVACPQEAIELGPAALEDGRLLAKPLVSIEAGKCNFCGECVVLCPANALRLTVNGEPKVPVLEYEVFPKLIKEIAVTVERCRPDCGLACQAVCPTKCIEVSTERQVGGEIVRILDVGVKRERCLYCVECEVACPDHAIAVTRPWEGRLLLDAALCPQGCQACVDVCPTDALVIRDGQLAADERFCLFCGACQRVCPVEGALSVQRRRLLHTEVKSGAWTAAVERLISTEAKRDELEAGAQARRRKALRFLPTVGE